MYVMFMNHIKVDGSVRAVPQALFAFPLCFLLADNYLLLMADADKITNNLTVLYFKKKVVTSVGTPACIANCNCASETLKNVFVVSFFSFLVFFLVVSFAIIAFFFFIFFFQL